MTISKTQFALATPILASLLSLFSTAHAHPNYPLPENGSFANGVYANPYFDLRYPVPAGWHEDVQGPPPSVGAYYSLAAFISGNENNPGTLLIAAQDNFFATEAPESAVDFLRQMRAHLDPSLVVPGPPAAEGIARQRFARLDYNGAGLYHAIFAVDVRCHTLIFSFTSPNPPALESVSDSLNALTLHPPQEPVCIRDYATAETIRRRVNPQMIGPRFASVPVRMIIGPDGNVEQVHAIAGFPQQRQSVRAALSQWKFEPYRLGGKAVAVETGTMFRFSQGANGQ